MKLCFLLMVVCTSASISTFAGDVLGGYAGFLEIPDADLLFQPCLKPNHWTTRYAMEDTFTAAATNGHSYYFRSSGAPGDVPCMKGTASFSQLDDGGVKAVWEAVSTSSRPDDRFEVCVDLRLPRYEGAIFSCGGESARISDDAPFKKPQTWNTRNCRLTDARGVEVVSLEFPEPVDVVLVKERDWGLVRYRLSLCLKPDGVKHSLCMNVRAAKRLFFREEGPVRLEAGKDWIPFKAALDMKAGSALDFSAMRGTDAPAGRHGYLVSRNGHFEFEKRPGVPVRFYGVNICCDANVPSIEKGRQFASMIRKMGYNALRIHHHEKSIVRYRNGNSTVELDPVAMRRFDALMAACIENGIYLTTDLFITRGPIAFRDIGLDRDGIASLNEYKFLVQVHEGAYSNFIAFARNFLGHVNEYTGRSYAQEPALSLISLVNEGNMAGVNWSSRKLGLLKDYCKEEMAECERRFARRVTRFLREEMKCRALLTNMNNYFWTDDPSGERVRAEEFDYADDHFYVDHPRFLGQDWRLPSTCPNTNPLKGRSLGVQRPATTRIHGMPFTISEYNFSGPGMFRGVGGILTGALGAKQDWDGLFRFAWSHWAQGMTTPMKLGSFDMTGDPLGLAAERASICLFLRGDLRPAALQGTFVLPPEKLDTRKVPGSIGPYWDLDWAAWGIRMGMTVADKAPKGMKTIAVYPNQPSVEMKSWLRTLSHDGVKIDPVRGSFTIDTPCTVGGFAEEGLVEAAGFKALISGSAATVWASSLDGRPLAETSRILVTHLTDIQNSGCQYADAGRRILLDRGDLPHLMRRGRVDLSLCLVDGNWRVYALASDGTRVRVVESSYSGGRLSFVADIAAIDTEATCLYEIVR